MTTPGEAKRTCTNLLSSSLHHGSGHPAAVSTETSTAVLCPSSQYSHHIDPAILGSAPSSSGSTETTASVIRVTAQVTPPRAAPSAYQSSKGSDDDNDTNDLRESGAAALLMSPSRTCLCMGMDRSRQGTALGGDLPPASSSAPRGRAPTRLRRCTDVLAPPQWIRLNVGGTVVTTSHLTLRSEPGSVLDHMSRLAEQAWRDAHKGQDDHHYPHPVNNNNNNNNNNKEEEENQQLDPSAYRLGSMVLSPASIAGLLDVDDSGALLLDADPQHFAPILNYLRHGRLTLPLTVDPSGVRALAAQLGVSSVERQLRPRRCLLAWGPAESGELGVGGSAVLGNGPEAEADAGAGVGAASTTTIPGAAASASFSATSSGSGGGGGGSHRENGPHELAYPVELRFPLRVPNRDECFFHHKRQSMQGGSVASPGKGGGEGGGQQSGPRPCGYYYRKDRSGAVVKQAALGLRFTVVLTEGGDVFTFGDGTWGQLGLGPQIRHTDCPRRVTQLGRALSEGIHRRGLSAAPAAALMQKKEVPAYKVRVDEEKEDDAADPRMASVACGYTCAMAVSRHHHVFFWGNNNHGQSGLGPHYFHHEATKIFDPVLVEALEPTTNRHIVEVDCGSFFGVALSQEGRVYSWGVAECLGQGEDALAQAVTAETEIPAEAPQERQEQQEEEQNQRATPVVSSTASPSPMTDSTPANNNNNPHRIQGSNGINRQWSSVSVSHTKERRPVLLLPREVHFGRAGIRRSSSSKTVKTWMTGGDVEHVPPIIAVRAGQWHCCALNARGEVFTWGVGFQGRLGHGSLETGWTPQRVEGGGLLGCEIIAVSCGSFHTAAITSAGELFCWGDNSHQQCGSSGTAPLTVPHRVSALQLVGGGVVTAVSCGRHHTFVVVAGPHHEWRQRHAVASRLAWQGERWYAQGLNASPGLKTEWGSDLGMGPSTPIAASWPGTAVGGFGTYSATAAYRVEEQVQGQAFLLGCSGEEWGRRFGHVLEPIFGPPPPPSCTSTEIRSSHPGGGGSSASASANPAMMSDGTTTTNPTTTSAYHHHHHIGSAPPHSPLSQLFSGTTGTTRTVGPISALRGCEHLHIVDVWTGQGPTFFLAEDLST